MKTRFFRILLGMFFCCLPCSTAFSQVNTEALRPETGDDGMSGNVSISITTKTGNVDYFDASVSAGAAYQWGHNLLFASASGRYAAKRTRDDRIDSPDDDLLSTDSRYSNSQLVAARYNRLLGSLTTGEAFVQVEYNEFLMMDLRTLAGLGLRLLLVDDDKASAYAGTGYMAEYERLDPDEISSFEQQVTLAHRMTNYVTFSISPSDNSSISSTSYFQPCIDNPVDYRILNESSLSLELTERLAWTLSFYLRYDSDPPYLYLDPEEDIPDDERRLHSTDTEISNVFSLEF